MAALFFSSSALAGEVFTSYELKEGRFSCQVPKGWAQRREVSIEAKEKAYGVFLTGPRSDDGVSSKIDVRWYAPGNAVFPKSGDFMKANLNPSPIPRKGEKPPVVEKTTVAGLPAQRFSRKSFQYIPPSSMDTKEIPVTEQVVMIQAKQGFYALTFSSADSLYKKTAPVFDKVVKSFKPAP